MDRFRFFDALTYGVRTLFWRPIRSLLFIAAISLIYYGYYLWAQSESEMAFFTNYAESTSALITGDYGSYFKSSGIIILGSMMAGCVMIAGAYRVYVRDEPVFVLPVQLGADELRSFGVYIAIMVFFFGLMIVAMIPLAIVIMIIAFIANAATGAADPAMASAMGGVIGFLVMIPLMVFMFYAISRLSVSMALTIRDRKFRMGGWKVSKGAGMQLLWAHIVLYLVMIVLQFALMPGYWASITQSMTDPTVMQDTTAMMEMMTNPYGDNVMLVLPIQVLMYFLLFGPTAAVANWDARKTVSASEVDKAN